MFGTFIYDSNVGLERKELWKDLEIYKRIVRNEPWFLYGDLNVTLRPSEHSIGGSNISNDTKDSQNYVNQIEVEDINSSGLFFTWTENLHQLKKGGQTGILKKLDRIIGSEDIISRFNQAYALFLPYIISDHCPTVLIMPKCVQVKKKPFKFANFITEKEEFMHLVSKLWDNIILAQELFKGYDWKMGPKRVALKVDIQKAYITPLKSDSSVRQPE
nr:RNA-directed DNA polymerase, eukaryota, reverse transcriptase zinc-binding domain protein [Tanacetum cinerariifolium]